MTGNPRADSASASSGNSVDSAFASSARILPRMRSSASLPAARAPALRSLRSRGS